MADLSELPESTKRKLALQWSTLLDTHGLTGEHLHWHDTERDRLRRVAAQAGDTGRGSRGGGGSWRDGSAADETGIAPSVAVAEGRFKDLSGEYWRLWLSSGDGYEAFVGWLDILRRQVSTEVASVWAGGSKDIDRWYERACGPAVDEALTALVKEGTGRARADELKRLERGENPKGKSQKSTEPRGSPSIISKLPKDALVRMEAATAAFMAEYLPKLEREANKRGTVRDAELLRELVIHQFNLVAGECMAVSGSVEEFEAELRSDIARFVRYDLSQYPWLAERMRQELDTGFTFFVMRANPWAKIPDKDRASVWHVGAITGEALSHAALELQAEAWKRAAEGGFPERDRTQPTMPPDSPGGSSEVAPKVNVGGTKRLQSTVTSPIGARRMEAYMESTGIGQTEFAVQVGTTDRTLRRFRQTGKVRRGIFDAIAKAMGITREALLKPE